VHGGDQDYDKDFLLSLFSFFLSFFLSFIISFRTFRVFFVSPFAAFLGPPFGFWFLDGAILSFFL